MRAEQEMEQVKRKATEELQKFKREESQEQLSTSEQETSKAPEEKSLQDQTGTEEDNPAGSNVMGTFRFRERIPGHFPVTLHFLVGKMCA